MSTKDSAIARDLCEFFEAIVHNILYHRGVYPKSMFIRYKAYGLSIYRLEYPKLKEYISETFEAVLFHLKNKTLEHVSLLIIVNKVPFEKYKMEIIDDLSKRDYDSLEQVFQKFYRRIGSAVKSLKRVPKEVSFRIDVGTTKDVARFDKTAEYMHSPSYQDEFGNEITNVRTHLFEFEDVKLHLFVEENCNGL